MNVPDRYDRRTIFLHWLTAATARIWWRFEGGVNLPVAGIGWLDRVASLAHKALYALLICTVLLGLSNAWVRGDAVFNLFTIRAFDPAAEGLRSTIEDLHALSANVLLAVAMLHAVAALTHHFMLKDDVLRRMSPRH
jgi:cytochrome b561